MNPYLLAICGSILTAGGLLCVVNGWQISAWIGVWFGVSVLYMASKEVAR